MATIEEFAAQQNAQIRHAEQLRQQAARTARALFLVALMHGILGTYALMFPLIAVDKGSAGAQGSQTLIFTYAPAYALAVVFGVLASWARRRPMPATLTGFLLFAAWHVSAALADPPSLLHGLVVKFLIGLILSVALWSGVQYQLLLRQSAIRAKV